jgi:asparagine synthase (glutamine-hydrolysing)
VVLTGEGSDELFAGYDRYWASLFNFKWNRPYQNLVPRWVRERCIQQTLWRWPLPFAARRALSHTFLARDARPEAMLLDNWYAIFPQAVHASLFTSDLLERVRGIDPYAASTRVFNSRSGGDPLEAMLYLDQKTYLVELLMKQDSMSMAASIESRVPFLDHHVVEFAARVPRRLKLNGKRGKWLVKRALSRALPPAILQRKKTGFPVPIGGWLRQGLAGPLREVVMGERARGRGIINSAFVERMIVENESGHREHTEPLWAVLNLELWARIFLDNESLDDICREVMIQRPPVQRACRQLAAAAQNGWL